MKHRFAAVLVLSLSAVTAAGAQSPEKPLTVALTAAPVEQADAPEWIFEALGTGSWKLAGTVVSIIVGEFISDNYDVLTKASASDNQQAARPALPATAADGPAPQDPQAARLVARALPGTERARRSFWSLVGSGSTSSRCSNHFSRPSPAA